MSQSMKDRDGSGFYVLRRKKPQIEEKCISYVQKTDETENLENLIRSSNFKSLDEITKKVDKTFNRRKTKMRREDDLKDSKFSKSNYILTHDISENDEKRKMGLVILASDTNLIFYDWDKEFWDHTVMSEWECNFNKKQLKKKELKEASFLIAIECMKIKYGDEINSINLEMCKNLLHEIESKKNPYEWLYKSKHCKTTANYMDLYKEIDEYGYYDIDLYYDIQNILQNRSDLKGVDLIHEILDISNQTKERLSCMFDYNKCCKDFEKILIKNKIEGEKNIIKPEFCEKFVVACAIPYLIATRLLVEHHWGAQSKQKDSNDQIKKEDEDRKRKALPIFIDRYNKLRRLQEKFENESYSKKCDHIYVMDAYEEIKHNLQRENKGICWGRRKREEIDDEEVNAVAVQNAIEKFFERLKLCKQIDERKLGDLEGRITWINDYVLDKRDQPMILLEMLAECGCDFSVRKKLKEKGRLFEFSSFYKEYIKSKKNGVLYAQFRYEMIQLLVDLHSIYGLSPEEQSQSWSDFFFYMGKKILSEEEAAFWRKYIGNKYDKIPSIGFQLYFVECVETCMPIDRQLLHTHSFVPGDIEKYVAFANKIKNNYAEEEDEVVGYINKCKEMKKCESNQMEDITKKFQEIWKDPRYSANYCFRLLHSYLRCFLDCSIIKIFPGDRCKVLELEVILRTYQNRQAKNKMYRWFKEIYGCSLDHIVSAAKHSAEQQAVHEGC